MIIVVVAILLILMTVVILSPLLFARTSPSFASPLEMGFSNNERDYLLYHISNNSNNGSNGSNNFTSSSNINDPQYWPVNYPSPFYNQYSHLAASEDRRTTSSTTIPYPEYNYHRIQTQTQTA